MKTKFIFLVLVAGAACSCISGNGSHTLHLLTTNDVHGSWFDEPYVDGVQKNSLFAVNYYVDSIRTAVGKKNVILIDAGDCLQGDNAAYYFNYVDTTTTHLFTRLVSYMKYDAVTVGNHDIETGHPVYDRVARELNAKNIPFLGGNAIRNDNGEPYFPMYKMFKRAGLKVAVLGYTNANMKAWLNESLWSGMTFVSLLPIVQEGVDKVIEIEKPDVVIVSVHSGTGRGDGSILESQAMDLYNSLKGVDFVVCSHDHRPCIEEGEQMCLINTGSNSRNLGHGVIEVQKAKDGTMNKKLSAELISVDPAKADSKMREAFSEDYRIVKDFTLREVGELKADMFTRDAYKGQSDYMNLLHTISLSCAPAKVSLCAPLSTNDVFKAGTLLYNDLFRLYRYENLIYVVQLSGKQLKDYLEASYDNWLTHNPADGHVLNMRSMVDPRSGQKHWGFGGIGYNLDSAGGLNYTVDYRKSFGSRVSITSLADGTPFNEDEIYPVAMTSYRASGGGDLLPKSTGITGDKVDSLIVARYPEMRELIYSYLCENGCIDPEVINDPSVIGHWEFVPAAAAAEGIEKDMALMSQGRPGGPMGPPPGGNSPNAAAPGAGGPSAGPAGAPTGGPAGVPGGNIPGSDGPNGGGAPGGPSGEPNGPRPNGPAPIN